MQYELFFHLLGAVPLALFQLRILDISNCIQWKVSQHKYTNTHFFNFFQEIQTVEKKEAVITRVARAVEGLCQCGFSRDAFYDIDATTGFQCFDESTTAVTFRGKIRALARANISQLLSYIEQWVATQPSIVVLSSILSIDSSCTVPIDSLSEAECSDIDVTATSNTDTTVTGSIVGGVLGLLAVAVIAVLVVVLVVMFVKMRRRKALYTVEGESVYE